MAQAGWYPDPSDAAKLRWWDGDQWTEHVTAAQPQGAPVETEAERPTESGEAAQSAQATQSGEGEPNVEGESVQERPMEEASSQPAQAQSQPEQSQPAQSQPAPQFPEYPFAQQGQPGQQFGYQPQNAQNAQQGGYQTQAQSQGGYQAQSGYQGQPYQGGYQQPGYQPNYQGYPGGYPYQQPAQTLEPGALYPMTDTDRTLRLIAFILNVLCTVAVCWLVIPLAWMIPMTVHSWGIYKGRKANTVVFGVCTLIFLSLISGILLLVSTKER